MENQINAVNHAVNNNAVNNNAVNNNAVNNNAVNNNAEAVKKVILDYVDQFAIHTKSTASSYLEMCKVVFEASEVLSQKDFGLFCVKASIGVAKASKLKLIGKRYETLKQYVDTLPVNWTTLYKLTHLEDERIGELVEDGKLYPEMPTKDLTSAAPELLEMRVKKEKGDDRTKQGQPTLQQSKELNVIVVFESEISDNDVNELQTLLERIKEMGGKVELSNALNEKVENVKVVEMEVPSMEGSTIEDEILGEEEGEEEFEEEFKGEDSLYEEAFNERLAA
jgi:hypothetical protein